MRAPVSGDHERMAELAAQLGYPCTGSELAARLEGMNDPGSYAVFVAETSAGIAGWIGLYIFRSVETEPIAEISGLVVDEQQRSRGIGRLLIAAAEAWARAQGSATLSVRTNVTRARAHHFYETYGFENVKTQRTYRKRLSA
ncbi:MAG TPA: GNAT family N-acetyltransferase [Terriglobales bacterium]|nr:GNAT family N-acetyltransferase [Terriglobales bacterium]